MADSMFEMVREDFVDKDKYFKNLSVDVKDKVTQRYVDQLLNADVKEPLSAEDADKFHKALVEEFGEKNFFKRWLRNFIN